MKKHTWSIPEVIAKLSHEPLGECFAATMAHRLYNRRLFMGHHRDYCGHEVALQMRSISKTLRMEEFEADEKTKKEQFIDWMDEKGYETIDWIVDMYDSRMLVVKKEQRDLLFLVAKEADFVLLPLLASSDILQTSSPSKSKIVMI